jgi:hypothetical protein
MWRLSEPIGIMVVNLVLTESYSFACMEEGGLSSVCLCKVAVIQK